jgi:hypothetical protein
LLAAVRWPTGYNGYGPLPCPRRAGAVCGPRRGGGKREIVLSHPHRKEQIHVFSLDQVLAADIHERIAFDPRTRHCHVIRPESAEPKAIIAEIERTARDTVASRLLIMDVRSYTLPRLQHAYNTVSRYNRQDLNKFCYSILIGDGPLNLFQAGRSLHVFGPHLARHRIDYYPAVFFYDPFIHYTVDEKQQAGIEAEAKLPTLVPKRLQRAFKTDNVTHAAAREYFRAAGVEPRTREKARQRRQERLVRFYRKRIAEEFPHHKDQLEVWLSKQGYSLVGEALRLHLYPLFFEDWVAELMARAGPGG